MGGVWGAFKDHDDTGSGQISLARLSQVFLKVSPDLSRDSLAKVLKASDCIYGDAVDYDAFIEWLDRPASAPQPPSKMVARTTSDISLSRGAISKHCAHSMERVGRVDPLGILSTLGGIIPRTRLP